MNWKKYFKLKGYKPGPIIIPGFGRVDFSTELPIETLQKIFEAGHEFVSITDFGREKLYGQKSSKSETKQETEVKEEEKPVFVSTVLEKIKDCKDLTELEIIRELRSDSTTVQTAYEKRLADLIGQGSSD